MIQASILIVEYNTPELLAECLASLKKNTSGSYEILLHDNSPPHPNLGFARANNLLVSRAKGEYIILLNPDTKVTPGWLDGLIETAESNSRIGIVQPKLLRPNGVIDSTGHSWSKGGDPYDRGMGELDHGQYDAKTELASCCFACALIKKELFADIGLFDDRLFLFFEDVDFCLRAKKAEWRVVFCPRSVVYHRRHGTGVASHKYYMPYIILKICGPRRYFKRLGGLLFALSVGVMKSDSTYVRTKLGQIRDAIFF